MDHPYSPSSLPLPATLFPVIVGIVLLCTTSLSAQQIPYDHRWISLRLFGESSEPLTDQSGAIRLVDPEYLDEDADRMASMPIFARYFRLPDREYLLARFPVDLEAIVDDTRMLLRLDADVDSIRLRDGIFHVPRPFEPFFGLRAAEGIRILEQDIACFEVADIENEPIWPTARADTLRPYRLELDRETPISPSGLPTPYPHSSVGTSPLRAHARPSETDSLRWVTADGLDWRTISDLPFFAESMAVFHQFFLDDRTGYTIAGRRIGHARDSARQNLGTYRTDDGGMTWNEVEALRDLEICGLSPYGREGAWFVGYDRWNLPSRSRHLQLYRGNLDGSPPTPISWPSGFDPTAGASEAVTVVAIDEESVLVGTMRSGLHLLNIGPSINRARRVAPGYASIYRAPDNAVWVAGGRNTGHRTLPRDYRYTLSRVAPDGNGWREILHSTSPLTAVTFFDVTLGALFGDTWMLLTVDGGRSWRYVPFDLSVRYPHFASRSASQYFFPDAETIRILNWKGSTDISLKDLPPPRACVPIDEWRPGTDIE